MKQTDNQMAPHIRKTVDEISGDIAQLQTDIDRLTAMRSGLVDLYGGETDIPEVVQTPRPKKQKTGGGAGKRAVADGTGSGSGRKPTAETVKLMSAARTAAELFTAASLAVATGLEAKLCGNRLAKWFKLDYLARASRGEFTRTKAFPQEATE